EDVPAAVDPVRPGGQQLTGAGRRQLVGFVAREQRLAPEGQLTQAGAEFGHGGAVLSGLDLILHTSKRNDHIGQLTDKCSAAPPPPPGGARPRGRAGPRGAGRAPAPPPPPPRAPPRIPPPGPAPGPRNAAAGPPAWSPAAPRRGSPTRGASSRATPPGSRRR